jgi:O-methyltransferase
MIGLRRLDNIEACIRSVIDDQIPGDLIETGVWRGGAVIFMRAALAAWGDETRNVWVADSFEGLPRPDPAYPVDAGDLHHTASRLAVSLDDVQANFRRYGLLDDRVRFLKGWFKDTLPDAPIDRLALIRLDGDMYSSTMEALTALYPRLSPGGFVIVDDYALKGAREAVTDFRRDHGIEEHIESIDWTGVFWRRGS